MSGGYVRLSHHLSKSLHSRPIEKTVCYLEGLKRVHGAAGQSAAVGERVWGQSKALRSELPATGTTF